MQLQRNLASLLAILPFVIGQQVGTYETETHPSLSVQTCTSSGSCQTQASSVVLDANWRWLHRVGQYTNCYTGNTWNATVCTNGQTCATNCALEGAKYQETYGITTSGNKLTLKFVTNNSNGKNVGSRVYLMDPGSQTKYRKFNLLNNEFTFTTDVSQLPCGLNGALYFIAMDADGGMSKYSNNKAGAKYGTGYCDAQCPKDIKFIGNVANSEGWTAGNGPNVGRGTIGTCCPEMDIWEANSISTAYTPHPCTTTNNGPQSCTGTTCSVPGTDQGLCDQPGCDWNSYRLGDTEFYGPGKKVDSTKPVTVVTQFITTTGTSSGDLKEIRRVYVQNGQVIANGKAGHPALSQFDSITSDFCTTQKSAFQDSDPFTAKGGMKGMGDAMKNGMVLALSLWHDDFARMLWLDSNYPLDRDANQPGTARGTCSTDSGVPEELEAQVPNSQVSFSDIRFGPIGSTYNSGGTPTNPQDPSPTNPNPPSATQTKWGQCGGSSWSGPTACASGSTCTVINQWYSQCT